MIFLILLRLALENNSQNRGVFLYHEKKTKKKITQP